MKPIKILLPSLFLALALFVGVFYYALKLKTTDLSDKTPYKEILNTTLNTKQPCFIAKNIEHYVRFNPYIILMDTTNISKDITSIYKIPVGTVLNIKEVKAFKNGVSGFTDNMVLGSVYIAELNKEVDFEFSWGTNPTYGLYEKEENYDIYHLAPWQEEAIPLKFFWDGRTEKHDWSTWDKKN
jgi:hypothetical protein